MVMAVIQCTPEARSILHPTDEQKNTRLSSISFTEVEFSPQPVNYCAKMNKIMKWCNGSFKRIFHAMIASWMLNSCLQSFLETFFEKTIFLIYCWLFPDFIVFTQILNAWQSLRENVRLTSERGTCIIYCSLASCFATSHCLPFNVLLSAQT